MSDRILELIPENLKGKEGTIKFNSKAAPFLGIYFSAHWCPPCRGFTPKLANFYEVANSKNKQIEIIFVSADRDIKGYEEYFSTMPWLAIPFGDDAIENMNKSFDITGIPYLIVFNNEGKLIDDKGRITVENRYPKNGYTEQTVKTIMDIWSSK